MKQFCPSVIYRPAVISSLPVLDPNTPRSNLFFHALTDIISHPRELRGKSHVYYLTDENKNFMWLPFIQTFSFGTVSLYSEA